MKYLYLCLIVSQVLINSVLTVPVSQTSPAKPNTKVNGTQAIAAPIKADQKAKADKEGKGDKKTKGDKKANKTAKPKKGNQGKSKDNDRKATAIRALDELPKQNLPTIEYLRNQKGKHTHAFTPETKIWTDLRTGQQFQEVNNKVVAVEGSAAPEDIGPSLFALRNGAKGFTFDPATKIWTNTKNGKRFQEENHQLRAIGAAPKSTNEKPADSLSQSTEVKKKAEDDKTPGDNKKPEDIKKPAESKPDDNKKSDEKKSEDNKKPTDASNDTPKPAEPASDNKVASTPKPQAQENQGQSPSSETKKDSATAPSASETKTPKRNGGDNQRRFTEDRNDNRRLFTSTFLPTESVGDIIAIDASGDSGFMVVPKGTDAASNPVMSSLELKQMINEVVPDDKPLAALIMASAVQESSGGKVGNLQSHGRPTAEEQGSRTDNTGVRKLGGLSQEISMYRMSRAVINDIAADRSEDAEAAIAKMDSVTVEGDRLATEYMRDALRKYGKEGFLVAHRQGLPKLQEFVKADGKIQFPNEQMSRDQDKFNDDYFTLQRSILEHGLADDGTGKLPFHFGSAPLI